ncbi:MAG: hypothetical protein WAN65_04915 [Candidatus Sulfotelmatobacter sp.]
MKTKVVLASIFGLALASAHAQQGNIEKPPIVSFNLPTSEAPEPTLVTDPKLNPNSDREELLTRLTPHPYLSLGPALGGGGYRPFALRAEGGINIESRHWVMIALAAYDNDRKTDDGDQPNPKGHDRYLNGAIYFRPSQLQATIPFLGDHWFFGAGYRWSQLSTTNYVKGGNRPQIGGGYDLALRPCSLCHRDFSVRLGVDWVMAGNDWQNGSHGPEATITFPTPSEKRHWFWRQRLGIYRFHESVTEPTNQPLTRLQSSQKYMDSNADFSLIYRF